MKYFLLILTSFLIFNNKTGLFSEEKKTPLNIFLRTLMEDSEAGYVLFNEKPICIHGYHFKDRFHVGSDNHKETVALKEGAHVWKKLKKETSDIIIHINQKKDPHIAYPFLSTDLFHREFDQEFLPFPPSFGFKTIDGELDYYSKKMGASTPKLAKNKPNFIFGWLKDDPKNKKLICDLERIQDKTQKLISSTNFELEMRKKILGQMEPLDSFEQVEFKIDKNQMNKVLAKGLWESFKFEGLKHLSYFIKGLENPGQQNYAIERFAYSPNYLSDFIEAKENLKAANSYFQTLNLNKDFQCVDPFKLYYKTIQTSKNSAKKCVGSLATLTYSIYSPLGHCLSHGSFEKINLNNTISGFAHGIVGMCIGETREILIHPSLSYSFENSTPDKCTFLKAIVTLDDIHNEEPPSKIKYVNLDFLLDPDVLELREINYKNSLVAQGAKIASHLKKCKEFDASLLTRYLNEFYNHQEEFIPTSDEEQNLINHVHWNIYWPSSHDTEENSKSLNSF